jgi:hypothetical protein
MDRVKQVDSALRVGLPGSIGEGPLHDDTRVEDDLRHGRPFTRAARMATSATGLIVRRSRSKRSIARRRRFWLRRSSTA